MNDPTSHRLTPHFEAFIEGQIAQGKYENATEVIEEGLRLLQARQAKLDQLSRALQEGLDSGEAVGFDVDEWLEARGASLDRLRQAVAESEASGEAVPFDMDTWLEEQDRLDNAA